MAVAQVDWAQRHVCGGVDVPYPRTYRVFTTNALIPAGAVLGRLEIDSCIFDSNHHTNGTIHMDVVLNVDVQLTNVTFQDNEG